MYSAIAASSKRRNSDEDYNQDSLKMINSPDSVNEQHLHSVKSPADKKPPVTNPETMKLYKLFQQEYTIVAEYKMLQSENLHGVYVIPSFENSFLWFGVIFVRSGCYEGGVFRFTVALADTFPDCECPVIAFQSQMFHPAVDPMTGQLSLSEVFPKWTKSNNHIWQLLKYVHWIFQNINVKSPANPEALRLFKTNKILFTEKAKESVMLSMDHLYDEPPTDDKHYISFSPYDPSVHDSVKVSMMSSSISPTTSHSQGLSWVQPGTFRPFTKADEEDESR